MLSVLSLTNIASRLLNPDLQQFFLANSFCSAIDPWFIKLEVECRMTSSGYAEYPVNLYRRLVTYPRTVAGANGAARQDDRAVLLYLASLTPPVVPDSQGVALACQYDNLDMVQYLVGNLGIIPTPDGPDWVAAYGHTAILQFLASLTPPILTDEYGASSAAVSGHLDTVKFLASLTPPILPHQSGVNRTANNQHSDVLEFLASLTPPLLPTQN